LPSFNSQIRKIKNELLESWRVKIDKFEKKPLEDIVENLKHTLDALFAEHIGLFKSCTKKLLFEGSGWENLIKNERK
jgi:hypothetical protein